MDENQRYQWQQDFNALPAMVAFGIKLNISDDTVVKVILAEILPQHLGGLGSDYVNGAVVAGLFDASLGVAGAVHYLGRPARLNCRSSLSAQYMGRRLPLTRLR